MNKQIIKAFALLAMIVLAVLGYNEFINSYETLSKAEETAYSYSKLIKDERQSGTTRLYDYVVRPIETAEIESKPNRKSSSLKVINKETEIMVVNWDLVNEIWLKIDFNGTEGYVDSRELTLRSHAESAKYSISLILNYLYAPDKSFLSNIFMCLAELALGFVLTLILSKRIHEQLDYLITGIPSAIFLLRNGLLSNFPLNIIKIGYFILALSIYTVLYSFFINYLMTKVKRD